MIGPWIKEISNKQQSIRSMKDDEDKRTTIAFHTPFLLNRRTTLLTESGNRAQESITKPQDRLRGRLLLVSLPTEIARGSPVIHFLRKSPGLTFLLKYSKLYSSNKLVCRLFLQPLKYWITVIEFLPVRRLSSGLSRSMWLSPLFKNHVSCSSPVTFFL